jgi:hypothetical protein
VPAGRLLAARPVARHRDLVPVRPDDRRGQADRSPDADAGRRPDGPLRRLLVRHRGVRPGDGTLRPGQGGFYFDAWSNLDLVAAQLGGGGGQPVSQPTAVPTPSPSAAQPTDGASPLALSDGSNGGLFAVAAGQPVSPADAAPALPQLVPVDSARGTVTSWSVRWDATGQYVAIWVASPGAGDIGQVSLFNVIPGSNLLNVGGLLLSASARSNIQFDDSQFVYTSPGRGGADGMTYLFQLPAIPPGPAATPALTMPGPSFGSGQSDGTAPAPSDR